MLPPLLGMAAFGDGMGSGSGITSTSLVNYSPNPVVAAVGAGPPPSTDEQLAGVAHRQAEAYLRVAAAVSRAHAAADELRGRCRRWAAMRGGDDPFARADAAEAEEERKLQERIRSEVAAAAGSIGASKAAAAAAPATGGGLFGTPAPAPATGGGLFGTPAPAPAGGGLFGAAPAPAPAAGGGLFGAPAPAAGAAPAFGAAAAPAFGAAAAPATSTVRSKSRSRGSRRR